MPFPWPWPRPLLFLWHSTWYAPCEDVTTPGKEFTSIQVPQNTTDRLISTSVQPAKVGNAMRVEVKTGDVAVNPYNGVEIKSGWRAEAIGPYETETSSPVRYTWSTRFDPAYVNDPRDSAGQRIWQVMFQWHQGDNDRGVEPPIAFTIVYDNIMLDLHRHDPLNQDKSIKVGEWPVAQLDRGAWHDFAAEIRWHQGQGTIRIWHNGVPHIFNPQGQPLYPAQPTDILTGLDTLFPPRTSAKPSEAYMKVGLYRKGVDSIPPEPFVLYHDEITRWEGGFIVPILRPLDWLRKLIKVPFPFPERPGPKPWPLSQSLRSAGS